MLLWKLDFFDKVLTKSIFFIKSPNPFLDAHETAMKNGNSKFNAILAVVQQ